MNDVTGIERLRDLADMRVVDNGRSKTLRSELSSIADQIERELDEEAKSSLADYLRVRGVERDMERHILGHEGMDDSPVARWARELREALGATMSRHESDAVAGSPRDALTDEDRDALEWVRDHGGLDEVRKLARYETKEEVELVALNELRHLAGVRQGEAASISKMGESIARRLVPEGCEWLIEAWPKFEDDAPVKLGDMSLIDGDADMVEAVQIWIHGKPVIYGDNGSQQLEKGERVKRPVLDADGVPIHTKPEPPDSWERIEEDADALVDAEINGEGSYNAANAYCNRRGLGEGTSFVLMAQDLVRRCRALAERERGE